MKAWPSQFKFTGSAKVITLWVLAGLFVTFLVFSIHLLSVFIWAAVFAYLFNPVITFLSKKSKIHRGIFILGLYVIVGLLLFLLIKTFTPLVSNELADLQYGSLSTYSDSIVSKAIAKSQVLPFGDLIDVTKVFRSVTDWVIAKFSSNALLIFFGTIEKIIYSIVFFVVLFYFLLGGQKYIKRVESLIPNPYRGEISDLIERVDDTLGAYIRAQVVLIIIMTVLSFVVLATLGIKYAIILSVMTGFVEVIPVLGPIFATAVVAVVALLQTGNAFGFSSILLTLIVIVAYFLLRQFEDYFVIPNVAARFVKVHPVIGILSLIIGGTYFGVLGLFLAIPAAAIIKVLLRYIYNKLTE